MCYLIVTTITVVFKGIEKIVPVNYRDATIMYWMKADKPPEEIAKLMKIDRQTVYNSWSELKKALHAQTDAGAISLFDHIDLKKLLSWFWVCAGSLQLWLVDFIDTADVFVVS